MTPRARAIRSATRRRRDAAVGGDHGLGPAFTRVHAPVLVDDGLERAHHGRTDGDHPAAGPAGVVDAMRRVRDRTRNYSAYGGSCGSSDDTPVCSTSGVTPTPFATSRVTTSGVNGRPALGISALPGSVAYTFWYVEIGQLPRDVAVADRPAVHGEVREQRLRQLQRRDPQPPVGARSRATAARQSTALRRAAPSARASRRGSGRRRGAARRPTGRPAAGSRGAPATAMPSGPTPSTSAASVPDVLITTRSPASRKRGQSEKCGVHERCSDGTRPSFAPRRASCPRPRAAPTPRAPAAARTFSSSGGPTRRSTSSDRRSCRGTSSAARYRPLGASPSSSRRGRAPRSPATGGRRCPRRGTLPGASACAGHQGRPYTRQRPGRSSASTAVSCSSAAFDDP